MGNASDFHSTGRNVDKEQDDQAFESSASPDLDGEKVRSDDLSPMPAKKLFPRRFTISLGRWFDAMSLQNVGKGFRSNDRGNLFQNLTSKTFRFRGKPATLVVRKSQPLITNLLSQNAVLLDEVLDDVLLPLVQPTGDGNDEK